MLVSMSSFSWRSSHPGPAAAAAAAVAVADGSAPAPAAATPSAPPFPSSEEVSLAMSSSFSSRSGCSSFSGGSGKHASALAVAGAAAAVAAAAAAGANASGGLSSGVSDDDFCYPVLPSEAGSPAAEASGVCVAGGSAPGGDSGLLGPAAAGEHPKELKLFADDALKSSAEKEARQRSNSGRRTGTSTSSGRGFTLEDADEAADKNVHGSGESHKDERRMSPPWDDSTLGLLGLTPDELISRVLQVREVWENSCFLMTFRCYCM